MQVSKWGNSLAVRLPAAIVEALGLHEGDDIEIQVAGARAFGPKRGRNPLVNCTHTRPPEFLSRQHKLPALTTTLPGRFAGAWFFHKSLCPQWITFSMPTSHSSDDKQLLVRYIEGWRSRSRREAKEAAAWREQLRKRIDTVGNMLVEDFCASKIILFGSFARAEASPGSDVDLLVTGIPTERLIEATVAAERIVRDANIDLVPIEWARSAVRDRAESEGVVLYDG